jgi:hypothetical protein
MGSVVYSTCLGLTFAFQVNVFPKGKSFPSDGVYLFHLWGYFGNLESPSGLEGIEVGMN